MTIKKQYLDSKTICKVTFTLSNKDAKTAKKAALVGEFNGWDKQATPMKKQKTGGFLVNLDLEKGREYQFRYLLNDSEWRNETKADKLVPTPFGEENSVVVV